MKNIPHRILSPIAAIIGIISTAVTAQAATLYIDYTNTYQTMEGIGTSCVTWDSAIAQFYKTDTFLNAYLNDLGVSVFRQALPFAVLGKEVSNVDDIKYTMFDFSATSTKISISLFQSLKARNPNIRIILTSFSPPAWMKSNNDVTNGGYLLEKYYPHFAKYLVEWCLFWKNEGVDVYGLSAQNELLFPEPYESCVWTPEQYVNFHKVLGPMMEEAGLSNVIICGPEHMTAGVTQTMGFVNQFQADPQAKPYLDVVATHGYTDGIAADSNPLSASTLWAEIRSMGYPYWMTETSGEPLTFDGAIDGVAGSMHNSFVGGHCSLYIYLNAFESDNFTNKVEGLRTISQYSPKYDAFKHYSKYVRPGMRRIDTAFDAALTKVDVSAFADDATQMVTIVFLNRNTSAQTIDLNFLKQPGLNSLAHYQTTATASFEKLNDVDLDETQTTSISLPARSMTTLVGTASAVQFPVYSVDATDFEVPAGSGSMIINVNSTLDFSTWRAESYSNWLTFESATGTGNGSIALSWKRNSSLGVGRTGSVEIAGKIINITQPLNPGLTLIGDNAIVPKTRSSGTITIESLGSGAATTSWTATSDAEWVTLNPSSGTGKGTVNYSVSANTTDLARTATLTIAGQSYSITQSPGPVVASIFPAGGDSGYLENLGYYYDGFYPFIWLWGENTWLWVAPDGASLADGFFFWDFNKTRWAWTKQQYFPYYYAFLEEGVGEAVFNTGM